MPHPKNYIGLKIAAAGLAALSAVVSMDKAGAAVHDINARPADPAAAHVEKIVDQATNHNERISDFMKGIDTSGLPDNAKQLIHQMAKALPEDIRLELENSRDMKPNPDALTTRDMRMVLRGRGEQLGLKAKMSSEDLDNVEISTRGLQPEMFGKNWQEMAEYMSGINQPGGAKVFMKNMSAVIDYASKRAPGGDPIKLQAALISGRATGQFNREQGLIADFLSNVLKFTNDTPSRPTMNGPSSNAAAKTL
ncbi:MAG: hypothetical protein PHY92_06340 [Alphaproteobacteria bacterium]|nr:hypothetical protein [Alphaproteobacteria bacterium]